MKFLTFLMVLLVSLSAHAEQAYENKTGKIILQAADGIYVGDRQHLTQIDTTWEGEGNGEREFCFAQGHLQILEDSAELTCESKKESESFKKVLDPASNQILKIPRKKLPATYEPRYLFQIEGQNTYVFIQENHFEARDFQVFMGPWKKWKKVSTLPTRGVEGVIPFASGGGIYIPTQIKLFTKKTDPGTPTMIRAHGPSLKLVIPKVSKAELTRVFKKNKIPASPSPCSIPRNTK